MDARDNPQTPVLLSRTARRRRHRRIGRNGADSRVPCLLRRPGAPAQCAKAWTHQVQTLHCPPGPRKWCHGLRGRRALARASQLPARYPQGHAAAASGLGDAGIRPGENYTAAAAAALLQLLPVQLAFNRASSIPTSTASTRISQSMIMQAAAAVDLAAAAEGAVAAAGDASAATGLALPALGGAVVGAAAAAAALSGGSKAVEERAAETLAAAKAEADEAAREAQRRLESVRSEVQALQGKQRELEASASRKAQVRLGRRIGWTMRMLCCGCEAAYRCKSRCLAALVAAPACDPPAILPPLPNAGGPADPAAAGGAAGGGFQAAPIAGSS